MQGLSLPLVIFTWPGFCVQLCPWQLVLPSSIFWRLFPPRPLARQLILLSFCFFVVVSSPPPRPAIVFAFFLFFCSCFLPPLARQLILLSSCFFAIVSSEPPFQGQLDVTGCSKPPFQGQLDVPGPLTPPFQGQLDVQGLPKLDELLQVQGKDPGIETSNVVETAIGRSQQNATNFCKCS